MREESQFKNEGGHCGLAKRLRRDYGARPGRIRRRSVAILALAATLCGAGFLYGQNQKSKKKGVDAGTRVSSASLMPDNQAVDLLVSQMLGAWQAGDAEAMRKFYADDMMVISGAWEPPLIGWANYARAYEDNAWVTYQWQFLGDVDGKRTQALGHTTLVLQKRAGNWLIVLNHTSAVPTDEPQADLSSNPVSGEPTSSLAPK